MNEKSGGRRGDKPGGSSYLKGAKLMGPKIP